MWAAQALLKWLLSSEASDLGLGLGLCWSKASHSISTGCADVQQAACMAALMLTLLLASGGKISTVQSLNTSKSWACMHACNIYKLQRCTALSWSESAQQ